ncbi:MAG: sirohydrochlorin chelatase [Candidatus Hodgkinia cicadicola]
MYLFFIGHGGKRAESIAEFVYLVDSFKKLHFLFKTGYWVLEFGKLALLTSFVNCAEISLIVPIMIFSSNHTKHDVCVVSNFLQVFVKRNLVAVLTGICTDVVSAALVCSLLKQASAHSRFTNCWLVLVCRGGSDSKSNSLSYSIKRCIWEGAGFAWCDIGFLGVTFPLANFVNNRRAAAVRQLKLTSIAFPMLLFYGDLYRLARKVCSNSVLTGYIFGVPSAPLLLFKRLRAGLNNLGNCNCSLCKYRLLQQLQ